MQTALITQSDDIHTGNIMLVSLQDQTVDSIVLPPDNTGIRL